MNIREVPQQQARYGIDPYLDWLKGEGIPVVEDYGVYLFGVETAPWPRYGVNGAAVHLKGRGDFANMFVLDIAPGHSTAPQRHLYEEVVYVLEGTRLDPGRIGRRHQAQLRMGREKPVRHSAQCQAPALQRQRHRARASGHARPTCR